MKFIPYNEQFSKLITQYTLSEAQLQFVRHPKEQVDTHTIDVHPILVFDEEQLVSFFVLEKQSERTMQLRAFSTDVRFQRKGYAKKVLAMLPVFIIDRWPKMYALELEVYTDNIAAIQLYRKYGFIDTFHIAQWEGRDYTIMYYDLRELSLHYFTKADFPSLINWLSDEARFHKWASIPLRYPLTIEQLTMYSRNANRLKAPRYIFKVLYKGKAIGHIALTHVDRENRSARIGCVLIGEANMRVKNIGERMMRQTLNFCFKYLKLHRVTISVYDFDDQAIDLYTKVGFRQEGYLRDVVKVQHGFWSMYEMSILEHDWIIV